MKRLLAASAALTSAVTLAACSGEEPETSALFAAPPWQGPESHEYRITDRGVDGEGRCTLLTTPNASPGVTLIERRCSKDEFGDSGKAQVDAATLIPISSVRVLSDSKKGKSVTHRVAYDGETAIFTTDDGERVRETERELPESSSTPGQKDWYDDESIIWMVRGLPLRDDFEGAYHHVINAGQPRILAVELAVAGPEKVTVPAGTFETWRVRVQRSDSAYFFWVAVENPHQLVRARVEDVTYELLPAR